MATASTMNVQQQNTKHRISVHTNGKERARMSAEEMNQLCQVLEFYCFQRISFVQEFTKGK